jgi:cyclophilin family peptidyl-prolyl cis-trans isomerase
MQSVGDEKITGPDSPSSSFFWVRPDRSRTPVSVGERHASPAINRLNNRFTLFAHVVEGNDVLELLRPGDVLLR